MESSGKSQSFEADFEREPDFFWCGCTGEKAFGAKHVIPNKQAPSRMVHNPYETADSDAKGIKRREKAPGDEEKAARETEAQASDREESHGSTEVDYPAECFNQEM